MSYVETPVLVAASIALISFAHLRLTKAAQSIRLEMAEKGERLLAQPDLPDPIRRHVVFLLETAFGMRAMLIASLALIPIFAALVVVRQRFFRGTLDRDFKFASSEQEASFTELHELHDRVTLANHPLLMVVVEAEMLAFVPLAILIRGVLKGSLASIVTRKSMMGVIEDRVSPRLAGGLFGRGMAAGC